MISTEELTHVTALGQHQAPNDSPQLHLTTLWMAKCFTAGYACLRRHELTDIQLLKMHEKWLQG